MFSPRLIWILSLLWREYCGAAACLYVPTYNILVGLPISVLLLFVIVVVVVIVGNIVGCTKVYTGEVGKSNVISALCAPRSGPEVSARVS